MIKFKRTLIITFVCIFILLVNISEAKSYNLNNSENKTNTISELIPENNELLFYSNYKNNEIKRFIKKKFTADEIRKINMMKNGLISFFGFNIKDNLNDIYDGEFILSTFKKPNEKREVLIIFKAKKENDINTILNIEDNDYKVNQIVEITRPKTLNVINYIIQTSDNFIICSSNKDLIYDALKGIKNNTIKNKREEKFKSYKTTLKNKKLFLYTEKQFYDFIKIRPYVEQEENFLTQFNFDNHKLVLNSFSFNNIDNQLDNHNLLDTNDIELLSNNINSYKNILNNYVKNNAYKELFEDISKIISDKILIKINTNNWIIGFKKPRNNFSINQLTSLNDFHQDKFKNDNYIYSIFSKNNLEFLDKKVIFKPEQPIFVYESNNILLFSNDISELLNTLNSLILDNILKLESRNLIIDDNLIIRNFTNKIYEDFLNILNSLNYFTANGLSLTIDTFESKTTQKIPEIIPNIQLKTYINFS